MKNAPSLTLSLLLSSLLACLVLFGACQNNAIPDVAAQDQEEQSTSQPSDDDNAYAEESDGEGQPLADPAPDGMDVAIFAGGCFWCMEGPFEALDGVSEVLSGYTGGPEENPTYHQVAYGLTGHTESVRVVYDPSVVTYEELLHVFWRSMDPTDSGGQFADRGSQYRPGIFVFNDAQRQAAEASRAELEASGVFDEQIVVPIEDAGPFYVAEDYHQDYYLTNSDHYQRYRRGSGRAGFLEDHWGAGGH